MSIASADTNLQTYVGLPDNRVLIAYGGGFASKSTFTFDYDTDTLTVGNIVTTGGVSEATGRFTSSLAVGGALPTNPQSIFSVISSAVTATANQSYYIGTIAPAAAVTIPTGTAPIVASLAIAEPNITATGTVTAATTLYIKDAPTEGGSNYALWVDAGVSRFDGNLDLSSAATNIVGKANTAAAIGITDGTTSIISIDTRNTVTAVVNVTINPLATTIAGASGTVHSAVKVAAYTTTTSTATTITALDGLQLFLAAPTIAQSGGAVIVTTASSLYISKVVAGSSVTITNNYLVNTDQAGCFCTAGGVWTDTASWESGKQFLVRGGQAVKARVLELVDKLNPATWEYRADIHGDDFGRQRAGIVYDDLPSELRMPGDEKWVGAGVLVSFALAAIKLLRDENQELKARLAAAGI